MRPLVLALALPIVLAAGLALAGPALAQPATSTDIVSMQRAMHDDLRSLGQDITAAVRAQPAPAEMSAKLDTIANKLDAILAQLKLMQVAPAAAGTGGPAASAPAAVAAAPAADPYFPTRPGDALFPSPENSRIVRVGSTVQGKPYLLDDTGAIHTLGTPTGGKSGYFINGVEVQAYSNAIGNVLLERQRRVYVQLSGGQWQLANPAMGNGLYNTSLPDAAAAGPASAAAAAGAGSSPTADAPAAPRPSAVAPGSSRRVLTVGKSCPTLYACVKAAVDGDTIDGGGALVTGAAPLISTAIELRNIRVDCSKGELTAGKGCLVNDRDVVYRNVEVFGATRNPNIDNGVGCIRPNGPSTVTIIGSDVHDCPQGVSGGGFPWVLAITDSQLHDNGLGDGLTHNLYASQGTVRVTLTRVTSRNPRGGHAIKSRAAMFSCDSCVLSSDETVIDLPDGTAAVATVTNSTLTKTPGTGNHRLIGYAEESRANGTAGVTVTGGTITGGESPFIQGSGTVTFSGVTVVGLRPMGQGVTLVGP